MKNKIVMFVVAMALVVTSAFVLKNFFNDTPTLSYDGPGVYHAVSGVIEKIKMTNEVEHFGEKAIKGLTDGMSAQNDPLVRAVTICSGAVSEATTSLLIGLK